MNAAEAPCRQAGTTVDQVNCLALAFKSVDAKLNQLFGAVLKSLQADDRRRLQKAERLWLGYRDAMCAAERDLYEGGTAAGPAYLACLEAETRTHTAGLRAAYGWRLEK